MPVAKVKFVRKFDASALAEEGSGLRLRLSLDLEESDIVACSVIGFGTGFGHKVFLCPQRRDFPRERELVYVHPLLRPFHLVLVLERLGPGRGTGVLLPYRSPYPKSSTQWTSGSPSAPIGLLVPGRPLVGVAPPEGTRPSTDSVEKAQMLPQRQTTLGSHHTEVGHLKGDEGYAKSREFTSRYIGVGGAIQTPRVGALPGS